MFAYGVLVCLNSSMIESSIAGVFSSIFISLCLFISIVLAGQFTGGHMNPAVTLGFMMKKEGRIPILRGLLYMAAQISGAWIGSLMGILFVLLSLARCWYLWCPINRVNAMEIRMVCICCWNRGNIHFCALHYGCHNLRYHLLPRHKPGLCIYPDNSNASALIFLQITGPEPSFCSRLWILLYGFHE